MGTERRRSFDLFDRLDAEICALVKRVPRVAAALFGPSVGWRETSCFAADLFVASLPIRNLAGFAAVRDRATTAALALRFVETARV